MLLVAAGGTFLMPRSNTWVAQTTLLVQDPSKAGIFNQGYSEAGRYVTNQVAFIESTLVADRAAEIVNDAVPGTDWAGGNITDGLDIIASSATDVITLRFSAPGEGLAIASVNAVSQAYQEVRLSEAQRDLQSALDELEASLGENNEKRSAIETELAVLNSQSDQNDVLQAKVAALTARIQELGEQRAGASTERLAQIDSEISSINNELSAYSTAQSLEQTSVDDDALQQERSNIIQNISSLEERIDELQVDANLAGGGILLSSPADEASAPAEPELVRNIILGGGMGVALGLGAAYFLGLRRKLFTSRSQPEVIFDAPLLGEVPLFGDEGITSPLPVVAAPTTASAEAHRFIASAIALRTGRAGGTGTSRIVAPDGRGPVVAVISAHDGGGKTTTTANTALAASRDGSRVAVVDADLGTRALTEMLENLYTHDPLDIQEMDRRLQIETRAADGMKIDLVRAASESSFLGAGGAASMLSSLRSRYDLILVDLPPILSVAYTASIMGAADAALVVVSHQSNVLDAEDVRDRLELVGTPVIGYVYNRVPLRPDMLGAASGFANRVKLHQTEVEESATH
jgi:Mrp family chromosome partitioning ATPase